MVIEISTRNCISIFLHIAQYAKKQTKESWAQLLKLLNTYFPGPDSVRLISKRTITFWLVAVCFEHEHGCDSVLVLLLPLVD